MLENNTPKVSLIIPVYNVEKYIRKALESVATQTLKDIEVIIINDGSNDSSIKIVEEFIQKYDNFRLINQENQGLSAARNTGLKEARGDYIAFMDSDDYLANNFLEYLYNLAVENGADISCCNYKIYYPKTNFSIYMPVVPLTNIYNKEKALRKLIMDITLHYYAWNKLYKRTLFSENDIEFPDIFFEDISTVPRLFYFANKVAVSPKGLYYYTRRKDSILNTMNVKKVNDYTTSLGIVRNFIDKRGSFNIYKNTLRKYALRVAAVNYYSILSMHFREMNFRGIYSNIKNSNNSIKYFVSNKFKKVETVMIDMPYKIVVPMKKRCKKKKKGKADSSASGD